MAWRRFLLHLLAASLGGSALLLATLVLLDPWGVLLQRPIVPHLPADRSQRWAYPEMARDGRFDGAIIGNSTARLLDPAVLGTALDSKLINLAMVRAYPYEQSRLLDAFLQAHPAPSAMLIGLDRSWCETGDGVPKFGYEPIPEWLYDGDRLAAVGHLFNLHAIVTAWQALRAGLGFSPRLYAENGFTLLDVDRKPYDKVLADRLIDAGLAEAWPAPASPDPASWRYTGLDLLRARLGAMPAETRVTLVFVPRFDRYAAPGSDAEAMMRECERRVVAMAAARKHTAVYDMAYSNAVTSDRSRWWDAIHARPETMALFSRALAASIAGRDDELVRQVVASGNRSASAR